MANSDIRKFNIYDRYTWTADDFDSFIQWLYDSLEGTMEGAFGASCLKGLVPDPAGGMIVNFTGGIALTASGRMIVAASGSGTFATPTGNPAKSLLVLRPTTTDMTPITSPTNPLATVNLHAKQTYSVVVIDGTPGVSPAYPAIVSGDVIICGVSLADGQTNIVAANIDYAVRDLPVRPTFRGVTFSGAYTVELADNVLYGNASAGVATASLPRAALCFNQLVIVKKMDSSSNQVVVDGYAAEEIDGALTLSLSAQNQSVVLISTGTGWAVLANIPVSVTDSSYEIDPSAVSPFSIMSAHNGYVFLVNSLTGASVFNLPASPPKDTHFTIKDVGGSFDTSACTIHRAAAEQIEGLAADYVCEAPYGEWRFNFNGTNWDIVAR